MSILIKGMEMPTNTDMAPTAVWVYPNGHAIVFKDNGKMKQYTEAVPVPSHYDLIDHNALKIAVMDCDAETRIDFLKHAMDCINKAPVVIPSDMPTYEAEEGKT